jgi:2-oxoglutarate ferredoxin oxidoreductase subunit gamma
MSPPAWKERSPKVGVRLSGTGGQGLVLAGKLLAEAAAIQCGLNVVYTKSYGPEARGGASRSDVIMSMGEVDDLVNSPVDVLMCLGQKACDKYFADLVYQGFLLVDSTNVTVVPTSRFVELPLTELAAKKCGGTMVTNVLALSALCALTNLVTRRALREAIKSSVRKNFLEQNLKAMELGYRLARDLRKEMGDREKENLPNFGYLREKTKGSRKGSSPPTARSGQG